MSQTDSASRPGAAATAASTVLAHVGGGPVPHDAGQLRDERLDRHRRQGRGHPVTGIQTAITLYTLVMASLMITGGKIGQIVGRKRAFTIGCVIYGAGSFITSIAPNLGVLIFGGRSSRASAPR